MLDAASYAVSWEDFSVVPCGVCGYTQAKRDGFEEIAAFYGEERESRSANAVLLDDLAPALILGSDIARIADVGAGGGQVTARLLEAGMFVDAYEPSQSMRALLSERIASHARNAQVIPEGLAALATDGRYDGVLCLNVLDHVDDLIGSLARIAAAVRVGGKVVISIPHPIKDRGGWRKTWDAGKPTYHSFEIDDYFAEGTCVKSREDGRGIVRVHAVNTYHRTVSTYFDAVVSSGLRITRVLEPRPASEVAAAHPVIYAKTSRIPYFLVLLAERDERP